MATGVGIQVQGLDALIKKLGQLPQAVVEEVDAEMHAIGTEFVNRAVNDAPIDQGLLRQGITLKKNGVMDYEIVSSANWSAFIEFGTKSRAKIPAELSSYAAQFKGGKGGAGQGFYDAILAWVKRKGLTGTYSVKSRKRTGGKVDKQIEDEQAAFAIYLSILRHGVNPHPFFFKQLPQAQADLNKRLEAVVKRATA